VKEATETFGFARKEIDFLSEGLADRYEKDLKAFLVVEAKAMELQMGRLESRIVRASNLARRFREGAARKTVKELEHLRKQACKVLRYNQKVNGLSSGALFKMLDKDGNDEIDEFEWSTFFANADMDVKIQDMELTPEEVAKEKAKFAEGAAEAPNGAPAVDGQALKQVSGEVVTFSHEETTRLFNFLLAEGERGLSKESFLRLVQFHMKVVMDAVMTNTRGIASAGSLKRLEPNEVIEVMDGPLRDPAIGILRIFGKAMNDGTEGWVTVTGSQGSNYLEEGGNFYRVVKETVLTGSFELDGEKASIKLNDKSRKLKEGTILEVYEWPRKEEMTGLVRMKGKVRSTGAIGWVTATGNTGTVFLEVA